MKRALVVLVAGIAVLVVGCGDGGTKETTSEQEQSPVEFVRATTETSPRTHLFGDSVDLRVDVVVNRNQLDPERISVKGSFKPYTEVGDTKVTRRDAGDLTHLRFDTTVRCLEFACISARGPAWGAATTPGNDDPGQYSSSQPSPVRTGRFAPATLLYDEPGQEKPRPLRKLNWPLLETVSRINTEDPSQVFGFPFRWDVFPLPALSTSISPSLLAALLLTSAALLLVLPVALIVRRLRRKEPEVVEAEPEASPLERALELVEWSKTRSGDERRAALEALADELDALEDAPLAGETRAAAWRPPFPSPEDAERVVAAVREAHGLAG